MRLLDNPYECVRPRRDDVAWVEDILWMLVLEYKISSREYYTVIETLNPDS